MRTLLSLGLSICISLTLVLPSQAATYKWVDENGQVHYSQKPPKGRDYERKNINVPPSYKSGVKSDGSTSSGTSGTDQDADKIIKDELEKSEAKRKENCVEAKKALQLYSVHRRVKGADGKVKVLSDKEREELINRSKQAVKEFCGN